MTAEVARREFVIGDRVTIDTQPDIVTGLPTIYRISAREGDEFMLVPANTPDTRPRIRTAATMTLAKLDGRRTDRSRSPKLRAAALIIRTTNTHASV